MLGFFQNLSFMWALVYSNFSTCASILLLFDEPHWGLNYPNLLLDFEPIRPNQAWVADITYIVIGGGFGYLSLLTDAYSRKIVGYYLSTTLAAEGSVKALQMAIEANGNVYGIIHHRSGDPVR